MNWKVRIALIVTAAIVLYAVLAWALSRNAVTTPKLAARVAALEGNRSREFAPAPLGKGLIAALERSPEGVTDLLAGISRDAVIRYLGWPDRFDATRWWFEPQAGLERALEIEWGVDHTVLRVQWLDRVPDGK